jgi:phosphoglycolate phosphatase-like HAD superfamily hydrolase
MPLLALFDVDGTLFMTHDTLAGDALRKTLEDAYEVHLPDDPLEGIDHAGQTSLRIARLVLRAAGLDDDRVDARLAAWCEEFAARYLAPPPAADPAPGPAAPRPHAALGRLEADGVRLALLTGNPEPVARVRMQRLGLARFFPPDQGAFGCEDESRSGLVELARRRAGDWPATRTVEIGDTCRDVDTAHEAGIRAILVPSGRTLDAEAARADAVVEDLEEAADRLLAWSG